MTLPVLRGCGCWGSMRGVWRHQDRRRRGPRELTGIVDHSRGGSSHGPLEWTWSREGLAPCTRTGWPSAEKTSVRGCESRLWIPSRDIRTPLMTSSKTPPACSMPFTSSSSPVAPLMRYVVASSKTPWVTADARVIPSAKSGFFCTPRARTLTPRQKERLREAFVADEAHISVEVAYLHRASARGLPPSHTRPRPTPGRSSHREPTKVSRPRNRSPGPDPTQVEGRTRCLLRHRWSQQRTATKPSTDIIELGRRTARGYCNPTNYQLRMLLIAGGLDASSHTQL